ncbi:aldehyde dehydrogenase family protein [Actinocorallia longicatena]|uniref:Aldehyde dehydrogenase family protein n=1 Tax=Actinocorallia longicatena TaxID=111803 RepID=A0ABP6Q5U6_9ACTN
MPTKSSKESQRLAVRKTYKLYIGGAFPRSESGRSYVVNDSKGNFLANASWASRKDVRDAVVAARKAFGGWSSRTAYNRGQILYRIAEMLEGRRSQFVEELRSTGLSVAAAENEVDAAVDRWVWYAGWADKIGSVTGSANPVAGPFLNLSSPEPTGVVAVLAPTDSGLLGLVSVLAPAIVSGNTTVVVTETPLVAVTFAEVLATSDLPGGVVNILTGRHAELAPWLAGHMDVNAIDLTGAPEELAKACEIEAAGNLKRVLRPAANDWAADPGTARMTALLETKTVWHPIGS